MRIDELIDRPFSWTLKKSESHIGTEVWTYGFSPSPARALALEFKKDQPGWKGVAQWGCYLMSADPKSGETIDDEPTGHNRDTFRIWATVLTCLVHFLSWGKPESVGFTGSTPELTEFYNRARARLEQAIASHGYYVDVGVSKRDELAFVIRKSV